MHSQTCYETIYLDLFMIFIVECSLKQVPVSHKTDNVTQLIPYSEIMYR